MAIYLVTGGCGYLGSRLVGHLIDCGHYVRVLDNLSHGVAMSTSDCIELNIGDVCCAKTVDKYMEGVDGCFHLADASEYGLNKNKQHDIKTTLTGGFNIFSAAAKFKVKVVYISSSAVYGDNAELPLTEQAEPCPLTAYAADKRALELHAKVTSIMESISTVGLRIFNVYGERYKTEYPANDVVTTFVKNIINNKTICIYGDGEQMRDYVYIDDAIRFMICAMTYKNDTAELFNVCSGEGVSINELARRVMCIAQSTVATEYKPSRSGDIYGSVGCPKKSLKKLHCKSSVNLNSGLKKLIEFYRDQPQDIDNNKLKNETISQQAKKHLLDIPEKTNEAAVIPKPVPFDAFSGRSDFTTGNHADFLHCSPRSQGL